MGVRDDLHIKQSFWLIDVNDRVNYIDMIKEISKRKTIYFLMKLTMLVLITFVDGVKLDLNHVDLEIIWKVINNDNEI